MEKLVRQGIIKGKQLNRFIKEGKYLLSRCQTKTMRKFLALSLGVIAIIKLWLWNWPLVLATMTGITLMLGVYWLQTLNWQVYLRQWLEDFTDQQRKLTIAVGSGGLAALISYYSASVWVHVENRWLALGTIMQNLATVLTLGLVSWQFYHWKNRQSIHNFSSLFDDLTDSQPLRRLITVRKLTKLLSEKALTREETQQLLEYFQIMLATESESIIQEAIWEGLQTGDSQNLFLCDSKNKIPLHASSFCKIDYNY